MKASAGHPATLHTSVLLESSGRHDGCGRPSVPVRAPPARGEADDAIQDSLSALRGLLRRFAITGSAALLVMGGNNLRARRNTGERADTSLCRRPRDSTRAARMYARPTRPWHTRATTRRSPSSPILVSPTRREIWPAGSASRQLCQARAGITVNQTLFNRFQTDNDTWAG